MVLADPRRRKVVDMTVGEWRGETLPCEDVGEGEDEE